MSDGDASQRLGRRGERLFEQLIDDAKLTVATLYPDQIGVDRIVSFPLDLAPGPIAADKREAVRKIIVQVKSSTQDTVSLTLSQCVHLKDSECPSVICLAKASTFDGPIEKMYFIHLIGKQLSRILKRLREASAKGRKLNEVNITFGPHHGEEVDINSAAIRCYLESIFDGSNQNEYANRKYHEIKTLGYEDDRFILSTEVRPEFPDQALEYILGSAELPIYKANLIERRFGIELEADPSDVPEGRRVTNRIRRGLGSPGALIFEDIKTAERVLIRGSLYTAQIQSHYKFLVTTRILEFRYGNDGYNFTYSKQSPCVQMRPGIWRDHAAISAMYRYPTRLKISFETDDKRNAFSFEVDCPGNDEDEYFVKFQELCRIACRIEDMLGIELMVSPPEIDSYKNALPWIQKLIDGDLSDNDLNVRPMFISGSVDAFVSTLVIVPFILGGKHIGIAAKATVVPDDDIIMVRDDKFIDNHKFTLGKVSKLDFLDIDQISDSTEEGASVFARRILRLTGLKRYIFDSMVNFSEPMTSYLMKGSIGQASQA